MKQYEFMRDNDENGNDIISVSDKPKRRLDFFPRLICLLLAIGLWLWMVNLNDTDITETMVLKIQLVGQDVLEDKNMMIYGLDKSEITVTVKGSNRDLRKYNSDEYKAVVDVSKADEVGQHTLPLTVTTPSGSSLTIAEAEPLNVSFKADYIAEARVRFDVVVSNVQDSGSIKYSYEHEMGEGMVNEVEVKGPASYIETISSARLNVDGSFALNADSKLFANFPLSFLDENLNPIVIDDTVVEYSTVDLKVNVVAIAHKEIPIRVDILNNENDLVATPSIKAIEIWGVPSMVKKTGVYVVTLDKAELGKDATHTTSSDLVGDDVFVTEGVQISIRFTEKAD